MEEKELLNIWKKGEELIKNGPVTEAQIEKLLKPGVSRFAVFMKSQLFTYMLAQIASIFLLAYNIYGYRGNLIMQVVSSALIAVSVLFLFFGTKFFKSFIKINQQNNDIFGLLKEKIDFFQHKFEWWNVIAAASAWILVFALNSFMDNANGVYRINKPLVFVLTSLGMMIFIYAINKSAVGMMLQETRACLRDLENALESDGESFARIEKRHSRIRKISLIILTILFIIGLLVFLSGC